MQRFIYSSRTMRPQDANLMRRGSNSSESLDRRNNGGDGRGQGPSAGASTSLAITLSPQNLEEDCRHVHRYPDASANGQLGNGVLDEVEVEDEVEDEVVDNNLSIMETGAKRDSIQNRDLCIVVESNQGNNLGTLAPGGTSEGSSNRLASVVFALAATTYAYCFAVVAWLTQIVAARNVIHQCLIY
jgi:hypothetical protein